MGRSRVLLAIGYLYIIATVATVAAAAPPHADVLARVLEQGRAHAGAPGMSAAVVLDNRLVWSAGSGLADVENDVPATAQTVYRIASISKTFAAIATLQLVERGLVKLDDPIQRYVPEFPAKGDTPITVRHILTHTSGIRHYRPGEMESREPFDSVAAAIRIFKDDPLLFTPGTKYSYSSYAFNLIAGVVEKASGLGYEAYLREKIWQPAGMIATRLEHPLEIVPHRARQYERGAGALHVLNAPYADLSIKWAGGGIISTVEDLARYHIAIDAGTLVTPETLRQMYADTRLPDGTSTGYGLGWMVSADAQGRHWVAHSGGATGGTTYLLRALDGRLAVALLCNVANAPELRELAMRLAESAIAGPTR